MTSTTQIGHVRSAPVFGRHDLEKSLCANQKLSQVKQMTKHEIDYHLVDPDDSTSSDEQDYQYSDYEASVDLMDCDSSQGSSTDWPLDKDSSGEDSDYEETVQGTRKYRLPMSASRNNSRQQRSESLAANSTTMLSNSTMCLSSVTTQMSNQYIIILDDYTKKDFMRITKSIQVNLKSFTLLPLGCFPDLEKPGFMQQNFITIRQRDSSVVLRARTDEVNNTRDTLHFLSRTSWKDHRICYSRDINISLKELVEQNMLTMDSRHFYSLRYYILI